MATMPPNRLLTLSMTINVDPACARILVAAPKSAGAKALHGGQITEAGVMRASRKETGPCGPVPQRALAGFAAQLSFWMYWPLSHSYIT
jgi:hypothetical protein